MYKYMFVLVMLLSATFIGAKEHKTDSHGSGEEGMASLLKMILEAQTDLPSPPFDTRKMYADFIRAGKPEPDFESAYINKKSTVVSMYTDPTGRFAGLKLENGGALFLFPAGQSPPGEIVRLMQQEKHVTIEGVADDLFDESNVPYWEKKVLIQGDRLRVISDDTRYRLNYQTINWETIDENDKVTYHIASKPVLLRGDYVGLLFLPEGEKLKLNMKMYFKKNMLLIYEAE